PTENHPIVGARIKQAVLRGAKLIVIDPREIELARYADLHLPVRPGTNVALLNAIANVIVSESLANESIVRERVQDFDAFRTFISKWTPEFAAPICGVTPDLIRQAAFMYATTQPAMCFHGLGMTEHVQGTEGVVCLVNLALLTGNFGKPGSGVNPLRGQNTVQGAAHTDSDPGNLMQMIDAAAEKQLKALWAIGSAVPFTNPNAAAPKAALGSLELVVVQDLFFNELAREFGHVF